MGFYMPVQRVCRPDHTFRGFQGQIEAGSIRVGDEIVTLPSNEHAKVKSILIGDRESDFADEGRPVTIQLDREVDVSRGCVLMSGADLTLSKSFTATILWMDDEKLSIGKDYLVKIGTKQIAGILKNIQYKIDVNTGEYIPANDLQKNEIAVCDITLQEEIVLDEFSRHKTLGELILIDRVSNMTSACGVVTAATVDDSRDVKTAFAYGNLKASGDIFEEFYYNLDSMQIQKTKPTGKTYTVGDEIPVEGESYFYPDYFDIIVFRDRIAIEVRDRRIVAIKSLEDYEFSGLPLINGRGFEIEAATKAEFEAMLEDLRALEYAPNSRFFNEWVEFATYRNIIFKNEQW